MTDNHIAALDPEPVSLEYLSDRTRMQARDRFAPTEGTSL